MLRYSSIQTIWIGRTSWLTYDQLNDPIATLLQCLDYLLLIQTLSLIEVLPHWSPQASARCEEWGSKGHKTSTP